MSRSMRRYCVLDLDEDLRRFVEERVKPRVIDRWEIRDDRLPPNSVVIRRALRMLEDYMRDERARESSGRAHRRPYDPL